MPGDGVGFGIVGGQKAFAGGCAVDGEVGRKATGGSKDLERFGTDGEQANVFGGLGADADLAVSGGSNGVDARLEPLQTDQCEPPVGGGDGGFALCAPGGEVLTPLGIAGRGWFC